MILIVDDDEDVRATIRQALETLAYEVEEAEDGPTALMAMRDRRPELVILDYAMPGMSGVEVANRIKAEYVSLPIVFASAYVEEADLRQIMGGDVPILHKPFRLGELAEIISAAL